MGLRFLNRDGILQYLSQVRNKLFNVVFQENNCRNYKRSSIENVCVFMLRSVGDANLLVNEQQKKNESIATALKNLSECGQSAVHNTSHPSVQT